MRDIDHILKQYWGYDSFRPLQREVIRSICSGHDTLALMPTGGGKSITYQVPALAMDGICIVVTPLISLMKDQIDTLKEKRIMAQAVHSGLTARQIDTILDNCVYGDYKLLYVSPERLDTPIFRTRLERMNVSMLAVDEAHCISQWGYDFRPAYLKIADIRPLIPDAPVLAVTATATPRVADDIMDKLGFEKPNVHSMSFARGNLSYIVRNTDDKLAHLLRIIRNVKGSGIVYCRTRKACEELAGQLAAEGVSAGFYHGGLSYQVRSARQEEWLSEQVRVIVATNAFGMGIDKSNVRYVVHYQIPDSLEAYYQEAGRAGRDGLPAFAVLLYGSSDRASASQRLINEFPKLDEIKQVYNMLCNYYGIAVGEGKLSGHDFNLYDFSSKFRFYSLTVLNSIRILQLCGYLTLTEELDHPTRIRFTVSREELYRIQLVREDLEKFVQVLLRLYTGLFSDFVAIDEEYIAHQSGYTVEYIGEAFRKLWTLRVLQYIPRRKTPLLIFNEERLSEDNLRISPESYVYRKEMAENRLNGIFEYAERKDRCRSLLLQNYFGEKTEEPCGRCDVCRDSKTVPDENARIRAALLAELSGGPTDIKRLVGGVAGNRERIISELRKLLETERAEQRPDGKVGLKS